MPKGCCCYPSQKLSNANYVYAAVEGNIQLDSGESRFVEFPPTNPVSDPYNCVRGNLSGFDPVTGRFTAPKTAIYQVSAWANYFSNVSPTGTSRLTGETNTQVCRFLTKNICGGPGTGQPMGLDIAIVGQTAPWSRLGVNFIASASLGGCVPLRAGEQMLIRVFQENEEGQRVFLFLEWMIVQGPYINLGVPRGPGVGT